MKFELDISSCEREQIHLIPITQNFGFLLAVRIADAVIVGASANCDYFLSSDCDELVGKPLDDVLALIPDEFLIDDTVPIPITLAEPFASRAQQQFICTTHRSGDYIIAEFEPIDTGVEQVLYVSERAIRKASLAFERSLEIPAMSLEAAEILRDLLRFDHIMIYRFDDDWHGTVIGESARVGIRGYHNHHFPASDIPAQARQLLLNKRVRLVSDTESPPVPIVFDAEMQSDETGFNLEMSDLRRSSEIHLEFLRNMNVRATLTIAIVLDGKLWGLVCGHHKSPYHVPARLRMAAETVVDLFSANISRVEEFKGSQDYKHYSEVIATLMEKANGNPDIHSVLAENEQCLMDITNCCGVAVMVKNSLRLIGNTPDAHQVFHIAEWLETIDFDGVFSTTCLSRLVPEASAYASVAAGLLAVELGDGDCLLWFKPAQHETVSWAGNPTKSLTQKTDGFLHPRTSFETWQEVVKTKSLPWGQAEIRSAALLRRFILKSVYSNVATLKRLLQENERLLQAVKQSSSSVMVTDGNGLIQWVNEGFEQTTGYHAAEVVGRKRTSLFIGADTDARELHKIEAALRSLESYTCKIARYRKDGTRTWVSLQLTHIQDLKGQPSGAIILENDVTHLHETETALRHREGLFRALIDYSPVGIVYSQNNGDQGLEINNVFAELSGLSGGSSVRLTDILHQLSAESREAFAELVENLRSGSEFVARQHIYVMSATKGSIPCNVIAARLGTRQGSDGGFILIIEDMSFQIEAKTRQMERELFIQRVMQTLPNYLYVFDVEERRNVFVHQGDLKLFGLPGASEPYNLDMSKLVTMFDTSTINPAELLSQILHLPDGEILDTQFRIVTPQGKGHWVLQRATVFKRNEQGSVKQFLASMIDLSSLKNAEEQLRGALAEKDILLKEVHHRVKNNMQIVASLLNLQANLSDDPTIHDAFELSKQRVRTMSLVHELLYREGKMELIDFSGYLSKLSGSLEASYSVPGVHVEVQTEGVCVPITQAIPLGLIANELIVNCFKHAFPRSGPGLILVNLTESTDALELTVCDDGIGLPKTLFETTKTSLGLTLVNALAEQLGARVELNAETNAVSVRIEKAH